MSLVLILTECSANFRRSRVGEEQRSQPKPNKAGGNKTPGKLYAAGSTNTPANSNSDSSNSRDCDGGGGGGGGDGYSSSTRSMIEARRGQSP